MSITGGGGAPRGGFDWALLGGDPTPGDVDAVAAIAHELTRVAELRRLRTKPVWTPQDRDDALRILLDAELARSAP